MTAELNKLYQYAESPPIDLEQFKAIANTLNDSDNVARRLMVIQQLIKLLHNETWRLTGILIKRGKLQETGVN